MTVIELDADRALKAKHRALWASGDYPRVAVELISELGPALVSACGVSPGQQVLDVAAGSGNAAIPAAQAGAEVTASDLTPELFDAGRRAAAAAGVTLDWVEADAEALPFGTGAYDVVLSCVGAMFAPYHQRTADELVRVCRPGGTIGMINWTPEGLIGNLFATMKPYAPPPPPPAGAQPPPLWGREEHVRELFGDRLTDLDMRRRQVVFDRPGEDPAGFREFWKSHYGPTIAVYKYNAADPARSAELDAAFDLRGESGRSARFAGNGWHAAGHRPATSPLSSARPRSSTAAWAACASVAQPSIWTSSGQALGLRAVSPVTGHRSGWTPVTT